MSNYKPIEDLTFSDDQMFGAILKDENACKGVIERLLRIKIDHIEYPELQKSINWSYLNKGIRMDVYVASSNKIYDIECQAYSEKDLGKRTRYYQSIIDSDILRKGKNYSELKESFILFLCLQDPFGAGLPVYTFDRTCKEDPKINLQDQMHAIFFNCSAFDKEKNPELRGLLDFVKNNRATTDFTKELAIMVQQKKFEQSFINEYMARHLHEMDVEERGINKGREEGKRETAVNLIKFNIPISTIAQSTGLSEDYIRTLM